MERIPTEQEIYQMSSQELTLVLYESLIDRLQNSLVAIREKRIGAANQELQKANDIVERLGAGINYEAGAVAEQFDALYNFVADRLYEANWKKDAAIITDILKTIEPIEEAWKQMLKQGPTNRSEQIRRQTSVYERNLAYDYDAMDICDSVDRRE
ncbi:flagellar export chaperone FliS [Heliobacillus mobilis]|uniref:Flagellar export chaperone FliS n=1 Tax=Heliobacterium mobile TaxID=28064 RepID=A0A6I3SL02_HELMO|nr:flagellar export chaperone FliS [Heliobacterium mobile]MTV49648.1 flagellar export chaperone FliS [Heliobacterium mobile]